MSRCDASTRINKRTGSKRGQLHLKKMHQEIILWDTANIESIVPWDFTDHSGKELVLNAITIIDLATGFF